MTRDDGHEGGPLVVTVPASSASALPAAAERLANWLATDGAGVPLTDVGYTLTRRRSPGRGRLGVVAGSRDELVQRLRGFAAGQVQPGVTAGEVGAGIVRQPVWVFSGQGSQWPGMGRGLLDRDPAFTAALTRADALIRAEAGFSVLDVIRGGEPVTGCCRVQPVLFAVQYALAAMWRAHGVEPAGVVGHSMGEVAAAVVAGALTLDDGVKVICRRSALLTRIAGAGAMASVDLDAQAAEAELAQAGLDGQVSVAVLASPGSTVVAGAAAAVERLVQAWEDRGVPARLIAVDVASHSPQVDPLLDDLAQALTELQPQTPRIPFYSTVTAGSDQPPAFDAAYWCANLRRPVQFTAAITAAAADRRSVYLEVSPHPVVTRAVTGSLAGLVTDPVVLPTLLREDDEQATFRTQLAAAHCAGVAVGWERLYPAGEIADVPPITFRRDRHWVEVGAQVPRPRAGAEPLSLPGVHTEIPGDRIRHTWRGDVGTGAVPWLADHQVHERPVLPGAAYGALAVTAACEVFGAAAASVEVRGLRFRELLPLDEHTEIRTVLTRTGDDTGDWEAYGRDEAGGWNQLATASLRRTGPVPPAPAGPDRAEPPALDRAGPLYEGMRACGIQHGPAFAAVTGINLSADGRAVWAGVSLPADAAGHQGLAVHPVLADACAQVLAAVLVLGPDHGLLLPTGIGRLTVPGDPATATHIRAVVTATTAGTVTGDIALLDPSGRTVARMDGVEITQAAADTAADRWFVEPRWQPAPAPSATTAGEPGQWLICADTADDQADDAAGLAHALRAAGATADLEPLPAGDRPLADLAAAIGAHFGGRDAPRGVVVLPPPGTDPGTTALSAARRLLAVAQAVTACWADPPRLYVLTHDAQSNLAHGAVRGVVRVLACEQPRLRATQIDVARAEHAAGELLADRPDEEVLLRGPDRQVAQLDYAPLPSGERARDVTGPVRYGQDGFRLEAGRLGELGTLRLAATARRAPGAGEIELRVEAAGMNFRDVLTVMGLLGTDDGARSRIGFECAGVVTATGPGVTHLHRGDRVLAFDPAGGSFGSFTTLPATSVAALPGQLSAVDAAGLPAAYLTAWYALRHVAQVQPGERVLIHSATGGTGQAAIAVARLLGAHVLATAGSEAKRQYLRDQGIEHVMDSRTLDFAAQVRAATGGEGVDVVLNSLAGPAIRAGLETLRPFGRFVELGVRDIMADAPLGMLALRHNITLGTVDLIELRQHRPEFFASLLAEVIGLAGDGRLTPLPAQTYPLNDAVRAFTLMAGAKHIGKIVLTVPAEGETTAVSPTASPARADGAYIVTGGLTGVGLATARWLALGGAGQVIVNGRSAPSPEAEDVLAEMRAAGCDVTVVRGDIAAPGTAGELAATVAAGLRLRGVVHSAMVLDDAAVPNITEDQLHRVWTPKVAGAWELHQATAGHQPDWFVVYSSMASLIGNPGQGAYAAANSWLDSFAVWRTGQGLPTLAVNWGPWGQIGAATDFAARGYQTIPTADGLHALGTLLAHGRTRTGVLPGHPDTWVPPMARSNALFRSLTGADAEAGTGQGGTDGGAGLRAELAAAAPGLARRQVLETFVSGEIQSVLGLGARTLDPDTPLRSLGFDSLLSIELGSRLESALGIKLGQKFVWTHPTVAALTDGIAGRLESELAPGPA
jgi:polyketide synthase 2/polyketide synthase 5